MIADIIMVFSTLVIVYLARIVYMLGCKKIALTFLTAAFINLVCWIIYS